MSDTRISATEIPVGTEFDVRLQSRLNSGTARVEDRFDATTIVPYERNGRMLVPAGSVLRGVVSSVTPATRGLNRRGELTLAFDRFTIDGRTYSVRATVMQALQGEADTGKGRGGRRSWRDHRWNSRRRSWRAHRHSDRRRRYRGRDRRQRGRSRARHGAARATGCAVGRRAVTATQGKVSVTPLTIKPRHVLHRFSRGFDGLVDVARRVGCLKGTRPRTAKAVDKFRARACL